MLLVCKKSTFILYFVFVNPKCTLSSVPRWNQKFRNEWTYQKHKNVNISRPENDFSLK